MTQIRRFYGKYRGTVVNIEDPMRIGRINVMAPDVLGLGVSSWAMPCLPSTGKQMGIWALPQVGSGVWVEFEQGNPDYPIWSGCWFGSSAEVPPPCLAASTVTPVFLLQTQAQNLLMINDGPPPLGGITLKTLTGAFIQIAETGITISNGKGAIITMIGPTVAINGVALTIT